MLGKGKRLLHRLERTGIEVVNLIADSRAESEIVSFRAGLEARERDQAMVEPPMESQKGS